MHGARYDDPDRPAVEHGADSRAGPSGSSAAETLTSGTSKAGNAKQQTRVGATRACDNCRRRKIRCDAVGGPKGTKSALAEQSCTLCANQGVPCHFEFRPPKRAPPKDYVESLEKRLEAMEELLSSLSGPTGAPQSNGLQQATPTTTSRDDEHTTSGKEYPLARDLELESLETLPPPAASPGETDLDTIHRLSERLDDLEIEHNRYVGRESGVHLVQGVHEHLSAEFESGQKGEKPLVDTLIDSLHDSLDSTVAPIPPDLGPRLIDAYYKYSEWGFTLLPRPYLDECLQNGLLETDRSFRGLYFAMCAAGSRFVDDSRLLPRYPQVHDYPEQLQTAKGFDLFWASMVLAKTPLLAPTLFDLMQSAASLLWLTGASGLFTAWTVVGVALRRAVDAGIHREARLRWTSSPLLDQLRKRLFFMLTSFDQWISATLGRPNALSKEDTDVGLPLEISDDQLWAWELASRNARELALAPPPPPPALPYAAGVGWNSLQSLFAIAGIARKRFYALRPQPATQQETAESLRYVDNMLARFRVSLPADLMWDPAHQDDMQLSKSAFTACHYFYIQIYVHRDFISPSLSHALGYPSLAIATNAARACARIFDTMRQRNILNRAYAWAPLVAVQAGMILLLGCFANQPGPSGSARTTLTPSAAADVKRCLMVLDYFADTTFMSRKCFDGLSKLAALIVAPPAARSPRNQPAGTVRTSVKRGGLDEWTDGRSPADSVRGSGGSGRSPAESGSVAGVAEQGHKARRFDESNGGFNLPFSTEDLSCNLFDGRPTFRFDQLGQNASYAPTTAVPPPPTAPDAPPPFNELPRAIPSAVDLVNSSYGQPLNLPHETSASLALGNSAAPYMAGPSHSSFELPEQQQQQQQGSADFQLPPVGSPDLLSALYSTGLYDSSSFWQLAFDDPMAVPSTVEQVASNFDFQLSNLPGETSQQAALAPAIPLVPSSLKSYDGSYTATSIDGLDRMTFDPTSYDGVRPFSGL
ncbi:hypothetical protein JCM10908_005277 [Rhodotorula pacifica]|uniref:uncharacterized protein n=1 Tax=Rhodotorula pacifica TaxID=1495444 RepID=UPI0031756474